MKLVQKTNQAGLIQVIVLFLILAGLAVGVYLVQQHTNLFPKAAAPKPLPVRISSPITPLLKKYSRVFVTSTTYDGNLGGLAGADAKCQARADAANLGGTWKAWLSDGKTSASSRLIHSANPYKLLDGKVIANNWADLTDGSLQNAINVTELNTTPSYMSCVWTQTTTSGVFEPLVGNLTACNGFTVADQNYSFCGRNGSMDANWTKWSTDRCDQQHPIYCFEQTVTHSPSVPRPTVPQIFQPNKK